MRDRRCGETRAPSYDEERRAIESTKFGNVTIDGTKYEFDAVINLMSDIVYYLRHYADQRFIIHRERSRAPASWSAVPG